MAGPTLQTFLQRGRVRSLYRSLLRATYKQNDARIGGELRAWIRAEFEQSRHVDDPGTVEMLLSQGKGQLRDLLRSMHFTSTAKGPSS